MDEVGKGKCPAEQGVISTSAPAPSCPSTEPLTTWSPVRQPQEPGSSLNGQGTVTGDPQRLRRKMHLLLWEPGSEKPQRSCPQLPADRGVEGRGGLRG